MMEKFSHMTIMTFGEKSNIASFEGGGREMARQYATKDSAEDESESVLVAKRIVTIRKDLKMTLQECSKRSGVAVSTLSKIERCELSPTISTLQKIAAGFSMELTELLTPSRSVYAPGRRAVSRNGFGRSHSSNSCANTLLCSELKNKRMIPIRTKVTARSTVEYKDWPKSDTEIYLFVLSGTCVVHSRDYEPLVLEPGDSVYYDASSDHCWTSVGDKDAEVVWIMSA
ncbi:cupin domain-containing protein [uncultured Cohaesibacter sp.]|uniref:helix-turn-helix domain-containing protein n=1 Tax=uncultured Cohaesibacter sp. TaxID=1002546 RepID=UPI0029C64D68|nr:cupin domain-containing protein [uncultured Cohaesibacter sp.]